MKHSYDRNVLWYDRPAENFNEALPIGNGRIAAMVYGGNYESCYDLNEETIFTGAPYNNNNPECREHLEEIRNLIFQGRNDSAEVLANRYIKAKENQGSGASYMPAGKLWIRHGVLSEPVKIEKGYYRRMLYVDSALTVSTYKIGNIRYREESFCSFTDNVMVVRITADKPFDLCTSLREPTIKDIQFHTTDSTIAMHWVTDSVAQTQKGRLRSLTKVRIYSTGGKQWHRGLVVNVKGARSVIMHIAMGTNFKAFNDLSGNEYRKVDSILASADKDYLRLKRNHIDYYKKQFDRVELRLSTINHNDKPTNVRIKNFHRTQDLSLIELLFQYGRYLLISSSQPGCQPANLQGKWSNEIKPAWGCRYTLNINTEMNYWPTEVCNLPELDEPLIRMTKELAVQGQTTAMEMYGCRGWVAHHNTDIWRMTGAVCHPRSGAWPMAGAWLCENLWRHYEYNQDRRYLADVYDCMKGAAQFYLDFLVEDSTGHMMACPSLSPENGPKHLTKTKTEILANGKKKKRKELVTLQAGTTMDNEMLFSLFSHVAEAAKVLGRDTEFAKECLDMRSRLLPIQIGKRGQILEWRKDWDSPKDKHRHVSHLWGLYPGNLITLETPELYKAARETLRWRGDNATGWSMAWKICFWARLHDGDHAMKLINNFITLIDSNNNEAKGNGGLYPNMLCAHPPFQIDGNLGFTAAIAEMLLQNDKDGTATLPALPKAWRRGFVKGLRAKRNKTIKHLEWRNGKSVRLSVSSGDYHQGISSYR